MKPTLLYDFVSKEDQQALKTCAVSNTALFEQTDCHDPRWKGRNIYIYDLDAVTQNIILDIAVRIQDKIRELENNQNIWLEIPMLSRWLEGDELDPPHADNIEPDGITPNASPWRSHGVVIYLNEDFEGGNLFYSNHNLVVTPVQGLCAIHRAGLEDQHGVRKVRSGTRHTIVTFATEDYNHVAENYSLLDPYLAYLRSEGS